MSVAPTEEPRCEPLPPSGSTLTEFLSAAVGLLSDAGCDRPREDAQLLIADALGLLGAHELSGLGDVPMTQAAANAAMERIERRSRREPVAYILGRCEFCGLQLAVDPRVHIPREDPTSLLVELAVRLPTGAHVHDVGTGSGAIALAVKSKRPDFVVSGSDISPAALAVARSNATSLGLDVTFSQARNLPPGSYDLVLACLPYGAEDYLTIHPPEVSAYQPHVALIAGCEGLEAIESLVAGCSPHTLLALEHAAEQADRVRSLLVESETFHDAAGAERVTTGRVR